jgi:hypothetical protein
MDDSPSVDDNTTAFSFSDARSPGIEPKLSIVVQTEDSGDVETSSAVFGEAGCEPTTAAETGSSSSSSSSSSAVAAAKA